MTDLILVHSDDYAAWQLGPHHPTTGARYTNAKTMLAEYCERHGVSFEVVSPIHPATRSQIETAHAPEFVTQVLDKHRCDEWEGVQSNLSSLAETFVGGTLVALEALLGGRTTTAVHFAGAKHHAMPDHASGFCVFNDFAIAAEEATKRDRRVAMLDIDVHHGDGTEAMLRENPQVLTFSIHRADIFPGTGLASEPEKHVYNVPLQPWQYDGISLLHHVQEFVTLAKSFEADLIMIAGGADGHRRDPMMRDAKHPESGSQMGWTEDWYRRAMAQVRRSFPQSPILFGGAGGYSPQRDTPRSWADMGLQLAKGGTWSKHSNHSSSR